MIVLSIVLKRFDFEFERPIWRQAATDGVLTRDAGWLEDAGISTQNVMICILVDSNILRHCAQFFR